MAANVLSAAPSTHAVTSGYLYLTPLSNALAGLAVERSLNRVLQRIAELAREVVGARYAALVLADSSA